MIVAGSFTYQDMHHFGAGKILSFKPLIGVIAMTINELVKYLNFLVSKGCGEFEVVATYEDVHKKLTDENVSIDTMQKIITFDAEVY